MPQLTIGPSALPISNPQNPPGAGDIYGQNNGSGVLYLSTQQDVSPTNYHALVGPGGSFSWPVSQALYACTDSGVQTTLTYLTNGATVDSGSSLSQSSNQPVQLFSQVTNIAGQAGQTTSLFPPTAFPNTPGSSVFWDISQFASLIISLESSAGSSLNPIVGNYLDAGVFQYDSETNVSGQVASDDAQWWLQNGGNEDTMFFQVPVKGHYGIFNAICHTTANTNAGQITAYVYGSYEPIQESKYANGNPFTFIPGKPSGVPAIQTVPGTASATNWIESESGDAALAVLKAGSTSANSYVKAFLQYMNGGQIFGPFAGVVNPLVAQELATQVDVKLPSRPVQMTTTYNGSSTSGIGSVTQ